MELAKLAKEKGAISDARLSLADICAAVLHARLDKSTPLRVRTDWDQPELSPEQCQYAALDAWASLQIYNQLSKVSLPGPITDDMLPGTPVSILQDDHQVIAHGILSQEPLSSTWKSVNHTKSRTRITVQKVLVPAAVLPLHEASLASFGPAPFDVLVKKSRIHCRVDGPTQSHHTSSQTSSPPAGRRHEEDLLQFFSTPILPDNDWTQDVDEPMEISDHMHAVEPDAASLQEGILLTNQVELEEHAWTPLERYILSHVLMDIWHAMNRIKVPKEHGCRRPFARALRDAMLIPDADDKKRISEYLVSVGTSWDEKLRYNARWLWKHCKRTVPPPDQLYPAVKEVFMTFGPMLDSKTNKPLFNSQAWKDAGNILKAIQAGLLSDPPGVPLYFQIGVDKEHQNLPIYRCVRGTNSAEGGVHHSGRRHLPISGVSARHASARLRDFVLMHNLLVSDVWVIYFGTDMSLLL